MRNKLAMAIVDRMKFLCSDRQLQDVERRRRNLPPLQSEGVSIEIVQKWAHELEAALKGESD